MQFRFRGFAGREVWKSFMPLSWQTKHVAWRLIRPGGPWSGADPFLADLVVVMPHGAFQIVDPKGNVKPYDKEIGGCPGL